jgi:hypothetical protein
VCTGAVSPLISGTREPRGIPDCCCEHGPQTLRDGAPWAALALEGGRSGQAHRAVAGLDVHKASVKACVRVPTQRPGERQSQTRTFRTTTAGLVLLRDWTASHAVTVVGMESTGVSWKPVSYLLEDDCQCWLLKARHLRNVPGPKTPSMSSCGGVGCLLDQPLGGAMLDRVVGHLVDPAAPDHPDPGASKDAGGVGVVVAAGDGVGVDLGGPGLASRELWAKVVMALPKRLLQAQRNDTAVCLPDWRVTGTMPARAATASGSS